MEDSVIKLYESSKNYFLYKNMLRFPQNILSDFSNVEKFEADSVKVRVILYAADIQFF